MRFFLRRARDVGGHLLIQKRPQFLKPMGCIGQQIVVVADLDENLRTSGFLQVLAVSADISQRTGFLANLGNADLLPVKLTEIRHIVQVVIVPQGNQGFPLFLIFSLSLYCLQPEFSLTSQTKRSLPFRTIARMGF